MRVPVNMANVYTAAVEAPGVHPLAETSERWLSNIGMGTRRSLVGQFNCIFLLACCINL